MSTEARANRIGEGWEMVVGLEVHAELATRTKLFSGSRNRFGGEPNCDLDPVSLGLPGTLPVLNRYAVELAIRVGVALDCTTKPSIFARKNYFYPDMPKDFQISQYDQPINVGGSLELPTGKRVGIERAHLEEDTGKSTHVGGGGGRLAGAEYSLVDYNRAGVPLIEIVSNPDIRSAEEARAYVTELRSILVAIGASDGKMEEGSLRVDANVSMRKAGSDQLGTRCEIKNMNSLRSLGRALEYEAARQTQLLEDGEQVAQETRHWDEGDERTRTMRTKEEADDYRYFPEPDLVPLDPDEEWIAEIAAALPPLPADRRRRLAEAAKVEPAAVAIAVARDLDGLAMDAIGLGAPADRVLTHVEHNLAIEGAAELDPADLAALVAMEGDGTLTATQAKQVLAEMVATGKAPAKIADEAGLVAVGREDLEALIEEIIDANPEEWQRFLGGDEKQVGKMTGFFVGQVMRATEGNADGKVVTGLLRERRSGGG